MSSSSSSYVPAGNCQNCGYPMDPGRCPECGIFCTNVGPVRRFSPQQIFLAFAIVVIPLLWAFATIQFTQFLYRQMTIGLVPGDHRFNDTWRAVCCWTIPAYLIALPGVIVALVVRLAKMDRPRGRGSRGAIALFFVTLLLGGVSWFVGLIALAMTIWNE